MAPTGPSLFDNSLYLDPVWIRVRSEDSVLRKATLCRLVSGRDVSKRHSAFIFKVAGVLLDI